MRMTDFAVKSLFGRRRKYLFLYIAITFGFFIMTLGSGLTEGMLKSVRDKSAFYFTGNVNVEAFTSDTTYLPIDVALVSRAARDATKGQGRISLRSIYYSTDAQLFGAGGSARQRRVVGLDWDSERVLFSSLILSSGALPRTGADERSALISETTANKLGARVGDTLTLLVSAKGGKNTATIVVGGVFRESGLFGYALYMGRPYLNRALGRDELCATDLGIYLGSGADEPKVARILRERLAREVQVFPLVRSHAEQDAHFAESYAGLKYMVLTLAAHLSSITTVISAITIITYSLLAVFLAIVLIGISNTYRVVVYERSSEIGTMRAIGMGKAWAVGVFIEEAALLTMAAALLGFILGLGALSLFSLLDFSAHPTLEMLLRRGHFTWAFDPLSIIVIFALVCATTLLAAWAPARKAAKVEPASAMRS
jgi:ABC-type lipoprotein release transport system permease subunit